MNEGAKLEFEGKSVEDAIKNAVDNLKVKREQLSIEILCEEHKGLFGMAGAKPAKIRVSVNKE